MNQVLIEFKEMVDDLQSTSSRLEKENILRKHNNEDIKEILNFIFIILSTIFTYIYSFSSICTIIFLSRHSAKI